MLKMRPIASYAALPDGARACRRLHQFLAARIAAQLEPMVRAAYEEREAVFAQAMGWVA